MNAPIPSPSLFITIWLVALHWFGDFYCQTDDMATKKSASNLWLSRHVTVYTTVLFLGTFWCIGPSYALFNGTLHWITDYFTSRWTSRLWKAERRHDFFVAIGLDQLIHYVTLFTTAYWFLK